MWRVEGQDKKLELDQEKKGSQWEDSKRRKVVIREIGKGDDLTRVLWMVLREATHVEGRPERRRFNTEARRG